MEEKKIFGGVLAHTWAGASATGNCTGREKVSLSSPGGGKSCSFSSQVMLLCRPCKQGPPKTWPTRSRGLKAHETFTCPGAVSASDAILRSWSALTEIGQWVNSLICPRTLDKTYLQCNHIFSSLGSQAKEEGRKEQNPQKLHRLCHDFDSSHALQGNFMTMVIVPTKDSFSNCLSGN